MRRILGGGRGSAVQEMIRECFGEDGLKEGVLY